MVKSLIKVISSAFVIVGTVIGAGFASGRELIVFFDGSFKHISLIGVLSITLFYIVTALFMELGRRGKIKRLEDLTHIGSPVIDYGVTILFAFAFLVSCSSMVAGIDEISIDVFSIHFPIMSICAFFLAVFFLLKGMEGLSLANFILVPIIIAFIWWISIGSLKIPVSIDDLYYGDGVAVTVLTCIKYTFANIITACLVMAKLGSSLTKNEIKSANLIASCIMGLTITVFLMSIGQSSMYKFISMPIIQMSRDLSNVALAFSTIVIFLGIFTTLLSSLYSLFSFVNSKIQSTAFSIFLIFMAVMAVARLGFYDIVRLFYPIESMVGLYVVLVSLYKLTRCNSHKVKKVSVKGSKRIKSASVSNVSNA